LREVIPPQREERKNKTMKKDPQNCPMCEAEEKGVSSPYGMSPEGIRAMEGRHNKEHCEKCPTCGQPLTPRPLTTI
jgi:hypothetical protein